MRSGTDPSPPCLSRSPAESGHHVPPSGSFLACPRTVSLGHKRPAAPRSKVRPQRAPEGQLSGDHSGPLFDPTRLRAVLRATSQYLCAGPRSVAGTAANGLNRIHQQEFEILPEAWGLLNDAMNTLKWVVPPMQFLGRSARPFQDCNAPSRRQACGLRRAER